MAQQDLFVKMIIMAWDTQNDRLTRLLGNLSDEQLLSEVAPGRNTGHYLIGHLAAVNDNLLKLLGLGEKMFPAYEQIFLENPDKSAVQKPSIAEVKKNWEVVTQKLTALLKQMASDDWFTRHTAVSEADFAKEPHRNKLNVLISRINHQASHHGQLLFLQKK